MKCLDEGTLLAHLDNELPEGEAHSAAGHLEACADCRARRARLAATCAHVHECLEVLALDAPALRTRARAAGLHWSWVAAALVALFFAGARKLQTPPAPARPAAIGTAAAGEPPVVPRPRPARPHKLKPRPAVSDFVPFDDAEPMQMGMVVRVMLPVTGTFMNDGVHEIAADLVIGEDGRARAIRLVE